MRLLYILALAFIPLIGNAQNYNPIIPPATSIPGGSTYHVHNDSTINDQDGSLYYLCAGVTLTVDGSAGCTYYLEENCTLIINDHDGDMVVARGNCSITDYSTESIVINKEASTTVSKPNAPSLAIIFSCASVNYDYSQVGGSSPCGVSTDIKTEHKTSIKVYPNPAKARETLFLSETVKSAQLVSIAGHRVANYNNVSRLDISAISPGIYFVIITNKNGTSQTNKLIIE